MIRWLASVLFFLSAAVSAQGVVEHGEYQIHYNAIASGFLTQDIATSYGILRSRTRGVLLVSVKHADRNVEARIEAQAGPRGDRLKALDMRSIKTDGFTSYLGSFAIADGESRYFRLRITPAGGEPLELEFSQQFFEQ